MIATTDYYGTATLDNFDFARSTASSYIYGNTNYLKLIKTPKYFYFRGLAFETAKMAKAYRNMVKSRETSRELSHYVAKCIYHPPKRVTPRLTAQSLKQRVYNKRKKFKEKLGLKH